MKKKILSLLLTLLLVLPLIPAVPVSADGAEEYDLYVADVKVTDANKDDVLGNGVFSYDPVAKKLNIHGTYTSDTNVIISGIQGLTIVAESDSKLTSRVNTIVLRSNATISGPCKLELVSNNNSAIVCDVGSNFLAIENAYITAKGKNVAIDGSSYNYLHIKSSYVYAKAGKHGIANFGGGVNLRDCEITQGDYSSKEVTIDHIYDLTVAGVPVTIGNKSDILGNGEFSYNSGRKILSVKENYDTHDNTPVIDSRVKGLKIYVQKNVKISSESVPVILRADAEIFGSRKLNIVGGTTGIFVTGGAKLSFNSVRVEVSANAGAGITGSGASSGEKLEVYNSDLTVTATDAGIVNFADIALDGCHFRLPEGGYVSYGNVCDKNGSIAKEIDIDSTPFDFSVNGVDITTRNYRDILGDGSDTFTYDPETNVLTVNDSFSSNYNVIANGKNDGLTIYIAEDVSLTSKGATTILCMDKTTITGPGDLRLYSENGCSIYAYSDLTIEDAYVVCNGSVKGDKEWNTLTVRNSFLSAISENGAISDFKNITLENSYLDNPGNGRIENGGVLKADGTLSDVAVFKPVIYDLWVGDTRVTGANRNDILGDGICSYDPEENELTLKGGTLDGGGEPAISSNIPKLAICVAEDTTLNSKVDAIRSSEKLTITGSGKLTLRPGSSYDGIEMYGVSDLTLYAADVDIAGNYGIKGSGTGKLKIQYSTVNVKSTNGAILDWRGEIELTGCMITDPEVDSTTGSMLEHFSKVARGVKIEKLTDLRNREFLMYVDEVYTVSGRGTIAEGTVLHGEVHVGDTIKIRTNGPSDDPVILTSTVRGIHMFGSTYDMADAGDKPGLLLSEDIGGGDLNLGDAIVAEDSSYPYVTAHHSDNPSGRVFGILEKYNTVKAAINDGDTVWARWNLDMRAQVVFDGHGSSSLDSGEETYAWLQDFLCPATLYEGQKLVIRNSNGDTIGKFTVISVSEAVYPIKVAGVQVKSGNKDDILGNGVFSFDPSEKKLTINGDFTCADDKVINNEMEGLTVYVAADSALITTSEFPRQSAIRTAADMVVTGPGKLTLSGEDCGLLAQSGACITIVNAEIDTRGQWGIAGMTKGESLNVINSSVRAEGTVAAISDFDGGIAFTDCKVLIPSNWIDYGGSIFLLHRTEYAKEVVIGAGYVNPFTDVKDSAWYFNPVMWAYYHQPQITSGTGDGTTFSPSAPCTRAQIVTFLWHAMGDPEPVTAENPFTDVAEGKYYYNAVLWAVENEVTSGIGGGLFGVSKPCKREQVVTFLWKTFGSPEPVTEENPFADVGEDSYYFKAVLWAVENGITSGIGGGLFGVGNTCTRAQIVTFLSAAFQHEEK